MLKRRRNNASNCNFFKYWPCLKEAGLLPNFSLYFVFTQLFYFKCDFLFKVTFVLLSLLLLIRKWSDPWLKNRDPIRSVSFLIRCTPSNCLKKKGIVTGEEWERQTRSSFLHSSVLNEKKERDPPTGAPRHYQQIDELPTDRRIIKPHRYISNELCLPQNRLYIYE
jgi:hypothetical protein